MKHTNLKIKLSVLVITITLIIAMVLPFAACTGDNELQAQIDDLKNQVEQLEEQIEQLEEQIGQLEEQIKQLEEETAITGQFYTLEEAYNNNYISRNDLETMAGYMNNSNNPFTVEQIDAKILYAIKYTYLQRFLDDKNEDGSLKYPDLTVENCAEVDFYGLYNNDCYCLRIWGRYVQYPAIDIKEEIDGVSYTYFGANLIIWKIAK